MKYTMYFAGLIACFFSIVAAQAQESKFLNSPARKLQLAEFAIANLYVDEVNEGKLVEEAIVKMLEQLDPRGSSCSSIFTIASSTSFPSLTSST